MTPQEYAELDGTALAALVRRVTASPTTTTRPSTRVAAVRYR